MINNHNVFATVFYATVRILPATRSTVHTVGLCICSDGRIPSKKDLFHLNSGESTVPMTRAVARASRRWPLALRSCAACVPAGVAKCVPHCLVPCCGLGDFDEAELTICHIIVPSPSGRAVTYSHAMPCRWAPRMAIGKSCSFRSMAIGMY